uniref:Adropin n=1 Tax=Paramormyrops kingsleyae TaxID=1676925 RepID=A0A3B3SIN6_9TELE
MGMAQGTIVAIVCNVLVAVLIVILFVILCKACRVPSSQERVPVLASGQVQQGNQHRYLLTP